VFDGGSAFARGIGALVVSCLSKVRLPRLVDQKGQALTSQRSPAQWLFLPFGLRPQQSAVCASCVTNFQNRVLALPKVRATMDEIVPVQTPNRKDSTDGRLTQKAESRLLISRRPQAAYNKALASPFCEPVQSERRTPREGLSSDAGRIARVVVLREALLDKFTGVGA